MKPLTYKITNSYDENTVSSQIEVHGILLFEMYGYQWAGHMETIHFDQWFVSEVSTGCALVSGKIFLTAEEAMEWAYKYLLDKGEAMVRFHVEKCRMKIQEYETIINNSKPAQIG